MSVSSHRLSETVLCLLFIPFPILMPKSSSCHLSVAEATRGWATTWILYHEITPAPTHLAKHLRKMETNFHLTFILLIWVFCLSQLTLTLIQNFIHCVPFLWHILTTAQMITLSLGFSVCLWARLWVPKEGAISSTPTGTSTISGTLSWHISRCSKCITEFNYQNLLNLIIR